ncbi:hypothetical protein PG984_015410 [Apiospora sp. TS-2023a]
MILSISSDNTNMTRMGLLLMSVSGTAASTAMNKVTEARRMGTHYSRCWTGAGSDGYNESQGAQCRSSQDCVYFKSGQDLGQPSIQWTSNLEYILQLVQLHPPRSAHGYQAVLMDKPSR